MARNAFDELLESIPNESDRKALSEIADRNAKLKEGYLRQSDYSRHLDSFREREKEMQSWKDQAEQWESWRKNNWVDGALGNGKGATKRELEYKRMYEDAQKTVGDLEKRVSTGGDNVTFEELRGHVNKLVEENQFVRSSDVEARESQLRADLKSATENFSQVTSGYLGLTLAAPQVAVQHYKEWGEDLDLNAVFDHTIKNGITDFKKGYESWVEPRRKEKNEQEMKAKIEQARKEGAEEALKSRGMNPGSMPDDQGGPSVGPLMALQERFNRGGDGKADVSNIPLGGGLARIAAREMGQGGSA